MQVLDGGAYFDVQLNQVFFKSVILEFSPKNLKFEPIKFKFVSERTRIKSDTPMLFSFSIKIKVFLLLLTNLVVQM